MDLCKVKGTILYSDGQPIESALVYAVPAVSPATTSSGIAIIPVPVQAYTTSSGEFELSLIQNIEFIITINCLGFREKIRVPALSSTGLFGSTALPINNDPITPDTGQNPDW
ncbi:MAG TPA: hypothetical protein P5136_00400 [Methanofastidiosum sp.]|nr:hypothetical protein [Methanofastidiosum sp.]